MEIKIPVFAPKRWSEKFSKECVDIPGGRFVPAVRNCKKRSMANIMVKEGIEKN